MQSAASHHHHTHHPVIAVTSCSDRRSHLLIRCVCAFRDTPGTGYVVLSDASRYVQKGFTVYLHIDNTLSPATMAHDRIHTILACRHSTGLRREPRNIRHYILRLCNTVLGQYLQNRRRAQEPTPWSGDDVHPDPWHDDIGTFYLRCVVRSQSACMVLGSCGGCHQLQCIFCIAADQENKDRSVTTGRYSDVFVTPIFLKPSFFSRSFFPSSRPGSPGQSSVKGRTAAAVSGKHRSRRSMSSAG